MVELSRLPSRRSSRLRPPRLRPPPLPTQELDRDDYVREFVKNAATLWEGNWAQAGEALSSKQRVSAMRDEAQREQGESVLDAMQQRHAQVTLAPTRTLTLNRTVSQPSP